ncbi:hypothetical protein B0H12DRAFT_1226161 [Mycena haematopus]|nr:hypothetical protein B0H12DRAFT_1226161 [Mycena haematopus]
MPAFEIFAPRSSWTRTVDLVVPSEVVVADAQLANYFAASAFTILFVDFVSTIDEEINFVWKRPWSIPSGLYLWNRYMTLFTVTLSMPFLFGEIASDHTQGLASTLLFGTFDLLLTLRVWILYGRTRRIAYILFPVIADAEALSRIVILLIPDTYLHKFIHLGRVLPGCYFTTPMITGIQLAFYAVPPLLVTFALFILTIYKCIIILRQDKLADLPVINLFLRDGIVWFIGVFVLNGSELMIWATARPTLNQVLVLPSLALFSVISSNILLKTRSLSSSQPNIDDDEEYEQLLPPVGARAGWRTLK